MANDDWKQVDPASLRQEAQDQYNEMKRVYRQYAAAKAAFEATMQRDFADHLPAGAELKFGYNFGKLSIAVGPKRPEKAKAKADTGKSLSEWLGEQAGSGRRC